MDVRFKGHEEYFESICRDAEHAYWLEQLVCLRHVATHAETLGQDCRLALPRRDFVLHRRDRKSLLD